MGLENKVDAAGVRLKGSAEGRVHGEIAAVKAHQHGGADKRHFGDTEGGAVRRE